MNILHFLASIPVMLGLAAADPRGVTSVTVEQTTIWRIPVRPHPISPLIEWTEQKGPKCIPTADIAGVMLSGQSSVDFVLRDRSRVRARIDDDCSALDFYSGIYVQPEDERLCVKRDEIRSRMGASCRIEKFRTLVPQFRR
ncbi:MAG: hypothetical protein ABIR77_00725 [Sphingomicrobium sp.]